LPITAKYAFNRAPMHRLLGYIRTYVRRCPEIAVSVDICSLYRKFVVSLVAHESCMHRGLCRRAGSLSASVSGFSVKHVRTYSMYVLMNGPWVMCLALVFVLGESAGRTRWSCLGATLFLRNLTGTTTYPIALIRVRMYVRTYVPVTLICTCYMCSPSH
jgi:hypothetical protein